MRLNGFVIKLLFIPLFLRLFYRPRTHKGKLRTLERKTDSLRQIFIIFHDQNVLSASVHRHNVTFLFLMQSFFFVIVCSLHLPQCLLKLKIEQHGCKADRQEVRHRLCHVDGTRLICRKYVRHDIDER